MKHTTNFIVYLNDEGKVYCAKCRLTGRFIKRAVAQIEYEKEYVYSGLSILTMFYIFFSMSVLNVINTLGNIMNKIVMNTSDILAHFVAGRSIVLFTHINTYLFKKGVTSEKEIIEMLNTGLVKDGRVL